MMNEHGQEDAAKGQGGRWQPFTATGPSWPHKATINIAHNIPISIKTDITREQAGPFSICCIKVGMPLYLAQKIALLVEHATKIVPKFSMHVRITLFYL
jgi:hypothetical protein